MDFLFIILLAVYAYAGDKANYYLKYHLLGVRAEMYGDTWDYVLSRGFWGVILGWATIPVAILHNLFAGEK